MSQSEKKYIQKVRQDYNKLKEELDLVNNYIFDLYAAKSKLNINDVKAAKELRKTIIQRMNMLLDLNLRSLSV
jgi:hypothetical protein